jgi:outer membrane lipoprotein LolB
MKSGGIRLAFAAGVLLLAACAGPRVRPDVAQDPRRLEDQARREQALAAIPDWSLRGRLGVSDERDGGSGTLEWTQHGDAFRFSVHAPVTGKTWVLSGTPARAVLTGLRAQAIEGDDARALLERELGWQVPVTGLVHWVRGVRAPGAAQIEFRPDGLPAAIVQHGWRIEFLDYDLGRQPPLPRRLFASSGERKVRLAIREWAIE